MRKIIIILASLVFFHVSSESLIFKIVESCQTFWTDDYMLDIKWLTVDSLMTRVPLKDFKLNNNDTVYFRFKQDCGSPCLNISIWNSLDSITIYSFHYAPDKMPFSTKNKNVEYWEEDLINRWDIDSIKVLSLLPSGIAGCPPYIYLARFIISDEKFRIDTADYSLPAVPDEIADSTTLKWRRERAARLGHSTRF